MRANQTLSGCSAKPIANATRFSAKNAKVHGRMRRRCARAASQPNNGITASVATKVAVNSHCRLSTPPAMPIVSRTGRSMK